MPIKIEYKTEQEVRDIPMTGLVSYSDVIDETYRLIKARGLEVTGIMYKPSGNGDTVTGTFIISPSSGIVDPDIKMSLTWTHSYHKAVRFVCNASAVSNEEGIIIIRDIASVAKPRRASEAMKYKSEIFEDLKLEIDYLESSFDKILEFKNMLKEAASNIGAASVSLGLLYVEEDVLTTSQASVIKEQIKSAEITNGWDMYLCFGEGLKDSHPKLFISDHVKLHSFFEEVFTPEVVKSEPEKLSLPSKYLGKSVDEEIKEQYNFVSPMPSVTFL